MKQCRYEPEKDLIGHKERLLRFEEIEIFSQAATRNRLSSLWSEPRIGG